jgi:hypothetical protein
MFGLVVMMLYTRLRSSKALRWPARRRRAAGRASIVLH